MAADRSSTASRISFFACDDRGSCAASADDELWVADASAKRCFGCERKFQFARRRHHCRRCGGVFCGACTRNHVGASDLLHSGDAAQKGRERVCDDCWTAHQERAFAAASRLASVDAAVPQGSVIADDDASRPRAGLECFRDAELSEETSRGDAVGRDVDMFRGDGESRRRGAIGGDESRRRRRPRRGYVPWRRRIPGRDADPRQNAERTFWSPPRSCRVFFADGTHVVVRFEDDTIAKVARKAAGSLGLDGAARIELHLLASDNGRLERVDPADACCDVLGRWRLAGRGTARLVLPAAPPPRAASADVAVDAPARRPSGVEPLWPAAFKTT